jgi:Tfp pilus assembly protein PilO
MKTGKTGALVFLVLMGVSILGSVFGIYYMMGVWSRQGKVVVELQQELDSSRGAAADLERTEEDLQAIQVRLNHLEAGVPEMEYVPTLLKELEGVGRRHEIEVIGVRPAPPEGPSQRNRLEKEVKKKPYEELNIEVKGRGQYGDVLRFVKALNSFPKVVAVRTLSMQPRTAAQGETGELEVTINLRAYLFKDTRPVKRVTPSAPVEAPGSNDEPVDDGGLPAVAQTGPGGARNAG